MTLSIFEFLNLFAALVLIGVSLHVYFSKHQKRATNVIFSTFLLFFSAIILRDNLDQTDTITYILVIESLFFGLAPLIYLYTCAFIHNASQLNNNDYLHFLPMFLVFLAFLYLSFFYSGVEFELINTLPWKVNIENITGLFLLCQFTIYLGMAIDKLRQYKFWLAEHYSTTEQLGFTWLNRFISGIFIIFTTGFLLFSFDSFTAFSLYLGNFDRWFYLGVNIFAVWAALYCLLTPEIFNCHFHFDQQQDNDEVSHVGYQSSKKPALDDIEPQQLTDYLAQLTTLMHEKKPYLDPNMGLKELAGKAQLPQRTLSLILNQKLNQSFYNYVNYYRVEEVKIRLLQTENRHAKLEGIAIDSGFRSSSTFNRLFKQHTQMTPQQFRQLQYQSLAAS